MNSYTKDLIENLKEWGDEEGLQAIYEEIREEKQQKKRRKKAA